LIAAVDKCLCENRQRDRGH